MTQKAVFLDTETLGDDFPLDPLKSLPFPFTFFASTHAQETSSRIQDASIVVTNKVRITAELIEKAPHLKLICVAATGYDIIDLAAAKKRNIVVCNVANYSTPSVVEFTILLILSLFYQFPSYVNAVRAGRWQASKQFCFLDYPIFEMQEKTVGIVGHGHIGKEVGRICSAFGMNVLFAAHSDPKRSLPGSIPLLQLLPQIDLLSIHVPLSPQTRNLISAKEMSLMKKSSFLVNVSRGGIVNESDLADALKAGNIAGAALDVLGTEPPTSSHPLLQKEVPNLILTPHIAWASVESRSRLVSSLRDNILAFLGGAPQNVISP